MSQQPAMPGDQSSDNRSDDRTSRWGGEALRTVVSKARESGRGVAGEVGQHAETLAESGKDQAAQYIRTFGQVLKQSAGSLRDGGLGDTGSVIDRIGNQVEHFAESLQTRGARDLMRDAEEFARARPLMFMGVALAAGFGLARFLKSAANAPERPRNDTGTRSEEDLARTAPGSQYVQGQDQRDEQRGNPQQGGYTDPAGGPTGGPQFGGEP